MRKQMLLHGRVAAVVDAAPTLRLVEIEPVYRDRFPEYRGGAHAYVRVPDGRMRQYSLCGPRESANYLFGVRREADGRGVSRFIHDELQVGDPVHVSFPEEQFQLVDASAHRFVAGGIGITAIAGLLYELAALGRSGSATLHYFARSEADAVFADEMRTLGVDVRVHCPTVAQQGPLLQQVLGDPHDDEALYICGPGPMLESALGLAEEAGWPAVQYESFVQGVKKGEVQGDPFSVKLTLAGDVVEVPAEQTLLEALREAGAPVLSACEGGICGTCVVDVEGGEPIHKDSCLTDDDRERLIITCVSRGRGELQLKL